MAALTRQRGHSLLELLVAVLVVGTGALGVAKLQMMNTQNNRAALEYSVATMLAEDMLERIRANPTGPYGGVGNGAPPPAFVNCLASDCAPMQLAAFDIAAWKCALGRWQRAAACRATRAAGVLAAPARQPGLPEGDGAIAVAGNTVTVTVTWPSTGANRLAVSGWR